jgi:manganese oxidase
MRLLESRGSNLLFGILAALILALVPVMSQSVGIRAAAPAPTTIYYNIYATDGWVQLADGVMQYMYGYIGGRAGVPLNYIDYGDPVVNNYLPGIAPPAGNFLLKTQAAGTPAPTAGGIAGDGVGGAFDEADLAGHAQLPGPIIYCRTGDTVIIRFKNLGVTNQTAGIFPPNDPHTIHLHGMDVNAANDGVPETSVAAIPANDPQQGHGNVIYYEFTPTVAGTYMYHCHQEADIHVHMGMYGALVVYNPLDDAAALGGPGTGHGGQLFGHQYDKDYIMLMTEMDLGQSQSEMGVFNNAYPTPNSVPATYTATTLDIPAATTGYNPVDYKPQYWLINGISFPNTIHANTANVVFSEWLTAHPGYDPLIQGSASGGASHHGEKVLVRMINLGFETQPMHVHGFHPKVIGMDQRAWTWSNPPGITAGQGMELNTMLIGSGQTMEMLFDMGTQAVAGNYNAGTQSRYNTVSGLPVANTAAPAGNPAIVDPSGGNRNPSDLTGTTYWGGPSVNPNIFPWHNHDDYKATNNGAYPGGQFTAVIMTP